MFGGVPLRSDVDYCDHCVDPSQVEALRVTPLRQLDPEQLGPLLFDAMSTWGDLEYFQHFLPRLLQLVADGAMDDWSYSTFLPHRLAACWNGGTSEQRTAISRFLQAWWAAVISDQSSPCAPRDVLEVVDGRGISTTPYLNAWSTDPSDAAVQQMADFVQDWIYGAFGSAQFGVDVDQWLRSDVLSAIFDQASEPGSADESAESADLLAFYLAQPTIQRQ